MNSPLARRHVSGQYDEELDRVRHQLLILGGLVEQQLQDAIRALRDSNFTQAQKVLHTVKEVDSIRDRIEEASERFIMQRQPATSDLRLIVAIIKITAELRIFTQLIRKLVTPLLNNQAIEWFPLEDLSRAVVYMLHQVLHAVARMDIDAAKQWYDYDEHLDKIKNQLQTPIIAQMKSAPERIPLLLTQLRWTRLLENIGDACQNVCSYILVYAQAQHLLN